MRRILAALMVVGCVLAGCGDDDSGGAGDARSEADDDGGTGSAAGNTDDQAADGTDGNPGDQDTEAGAGPDAGGTGSGDGDDADPGSGDSASPGDFCGQVRDLESHMSEFEGIDPNDEAAVQTGLDELAEVYEGIEPPAEIADAWRITTSAFDQNAQVAPDQLDQAAITAAGDGVATYLRDVCGITGE